MFSEQLKKDTSLAHMDLERKMIPLLKNISDLRGYLNLLDFMYGYYQALEKELEPYLREPMHHSNATNIMMDIRSIDPDFPVSPTRTANIPNITSPEKALGVMYVLEGSTLGGQIITKMLSNQMNDESTGGFTFYNPYGGETMQKWVAFKEKLNADFNDQQKLEIVAGANETFSTLNSWISSYVHDANTRQV